MTAPVREWDAEVAEALAAAERAKTRASALADVAPNRSSASDPKRFLETPPDDSWRTYAEQAERAMLARREAHVLAGCNKRPCHECEVARCARCAGDVLFSELLSAARLKLQASPQHRVTCPTCVPAELRAVLLASARASVPEWYRGVRFDGRDFPAHILAGKGAHLIQHARSALAARHATFVGPADTGKTMLLAAMFNDVLDRAEQLDADGRTVARGAGALWVSAFKLSTARAQFPLGQHVDPPLLAQAKSATVLVIDDIGSELGIAGRQEGVKEVVFDRFENGAVTWASTGLGSKELGVAYGGGFLRRIAGAEGAFCIRMLTGPAAVGGTP